MYVCIYLSIYLSVCLSVCLWLLSWWSLSGSVVVLKEIAHTALMTQTYIVTENDNEKVIDKNESVKELVAELSNAVQSGKKELESVEVLQNYLYLFARKMILYVGRHLNGCGILLHFIEKRQRYDFFVRSKNPNYLELSGK